MKAGFKVEYAVKCDRYSEFLYVFNYHATNIISNIAYNTQAKVFYGGQVGVWKIKKMKS